MRKNELITKAEIIKDISKSFSPKPIDSTNMFYTEVDDVRNDNGLPKILEIKGLLEDINNAKILLAGHMGSGKSTELFRLGHLIEKEYEVIKFSIQNTNDPIGIQYEDLLIACIDQVLNHIKDNNLIEKIDASLLDEFAAWINNIETIKEKTEKTEANATAEIGVSAKVSFIFSFMAKLSSTLKVGSEEKITYRYAIDKTVTQLLTIAKRLFIASNDILEKEIVLIIEDLDKVDTEKAKDIFINKSSILSAIPLNIIYTVPIFLLHKSEFSVLEGNTFHCVTLPMIKTRNSHNIDEKYDTGILKIKELISKRMNLKLFENDEVVEYLIVMTGGVLRDLFQIIVKSSKYCDHKNLTQITKKTIDIYLNEKASFYYRALSGASDRGINSSDVIDSLANLYNNNILKPKTIDTNVLELLRAQVLIEYSNGDSWYAIHPLMINHIKNIKE